MKLSAFLHHVECQRYFPVQATSAKPELTRVDGFSIGATPIFRAIPPVPSPSYLRMDLLISMYVYKDGERLLMTFSCKIFNNNTPFIVFASIYMVGCRLEL